MNNNGALSTIIPDRDKKRSVGLFGGSFNPIHIGHISLARQLLRLAGLDAIWFMVSPQNPLKESSDLLDDRLRFDMTKEALANEEGLTACDYELQLPKPSYTWNTLLHLRQDYPHLSFVLLIGGDNWELFPKWYHAEDIIKNYHIVIYPRRGSEIDRTQLPENVKMVETELLDISSTMIRERIKKGESIKGLVPPTIEKLVEACYQQMSY